MNILILLIILYFVPSIIALFRIHRDFLLIFFVNILIGWTFFGWLLVLFWAIFGGRHGRTYSFTYNGNRSNSKNHGRIRGGSGAENKSSKKSEPLSELKSEFAKGNITEEEYFRRKKILDEE